MNLIQTLNQTTTTFEIIPTVDFSLLIVLFGIIAFGGIIFIIVFLMEGFGALPLMIATGATTVFIFSAIYTGITTSNHNGEAIETTIANLEETYNISLEAPNTDIAGNQTNAFSPPIPPETIAEALEEAARSGEESTLYNNVQMWFTNEAGELYSTDVVLTANGKNEGQLFTAVDASANELVPFDATVLTKNSSKFETFDSSKNSE